MHIYFLSGCRQGIELVSAADVKKMFDIAHEVRGQGGSFDFPLITSIGDSLCRFLEPLDSLTGRDLAALRNRGRPGSWFAGGI